MGLAVGGNGGDRHWRKGAWPLMGWGEAVLVLDLERKILETGLPGSAVSLRRPQLQEKMLARRFSVCSMRLCEAPKSLKWGSQILKQRRDFCGLGESVMSQSAFLFLFLLRRRRRRVFYTMFRSPGWPFLATPRLMIWSGTRSAGSAVLGTTRITITMVRGFQDYTWLS